MGETQEYDVRIRRLDLAHARKNDTAQRVISLQDLQDREGDVSRGEIFAIVPFDAATQRKANGQTIGRCVSSGG